MTQSYKELTDDLSQSLAELRQNIPETMKGFSSLAQGATQDDALDKKTKELIALTVGVTSHCHGCIGFHAKSLARLGASKAEVMEALGMAVYMGGGPALMYAADAVKAFGEFSDET